MQAACHESRGGRDGRMVLLPEQGLAAAPDPDWLHAVGPGERALMVGIPGHDVDELAARHSAPIGGPNYIRVLKAPFPDLPMIASGGVNQQTAAEFILAGSAVLGVGAELIPQEAVHRRQPDWIQELGKRFTDIVKHARQQLAARHADHKA